MFLLSSVWKHELFKVGRKVNAVGTGADKFSNFNECFYNSKETRSTFSIFY